MLDINQLRSPLFGPISLSVAGGECVTLRGASGSGKTLFLRALLDLDVAQGSVTLDGVPSTAMPGWQWRRRVAMVPAQSGWWADRVDAHFHRADDPALAGWLDALGVPADALQWTVDRLSTGEMHRLAIIRALLARPSVLVLDEPTAALDPVATERVEQLLQRLVGDGLALLMVTHDADQAQRLGRRRFWLREGGLVDDPGRGVAA